MVPATLLAAIAFQESAYNEKAIGPEIPGKGWRALGLMQLSPANVRQYRVANPLEASDSLNGAAKLLANLLRASDHKIASAVAAYNWGIGNVNKGKRWPASVNAYVKSVLSNRLWLQSQALPPEGETLYERLRNAVVNLRAVNPGVVEIRELYAALNNYDMLHRALPDADFIRVPVVVTTLTEYARLYDAAPVTGAVTPRPEWLVASAPEPLRTMAEKLVQPPPEFRGLTPEDADKTDGRGVITLTPQVIYGRVPEEDGVGVVGMLLAFLVMWAVTSSKERGAWFGA